eukprot:Nitzschia sp. Nitz4//scaffold32_size149145//124555//125505//NITZ4_002898-RA/size149145-processed-gene-0.103-mRNA-1//1//CDS//3329548126//340//frame0
MTSNEATEGINDSNVPRTSGQSVPKEDLTELVRAIKFAKPDASQRQVHREITEDLAAKHEETFGEILRTVQLNDVKKVWKKALQQQTSGSSGSSVKQSNADIQAKLQGQNQPPQLFTIGVNNSVQFLAQEYTAASLAEKEAELKAEQDSRDALIRDFVHVFLDVPHDRSGTRPHQAIINFQSKAASKAKGGGSSSNKNKKKGPSQPSAAPPATEEREIVKIQRAAPIHEADTTQHPMLLYNQNRTHKTFVHPDPTDELRGYERIQELMKPGAQEGALGATGGLKAYFYVNHIPGAKQGQPGILSIDVTQLAPPQEW